MMVRAIAFLLKLILNDLMKTLKYIYLFLIGTLLFVACDNEDFSNLADDEIAISYALQNYVTVEGLSSSGHNIASMRNITAKEADENRIDNVYILLFGKDVKRYYTSTTSFNEGEWNKKESCEN